MRIIKTAALFAALFFLLCACAREPLTDTVLFCADYNTRAGNTAVCEENVFLRSEKETVIFPGDAVIRLQCGENGAVHTASVTGKPGSATAGVAENAFAVLAQPLSETVPEAVLQLLKKPPQSVQSIETKRFSYFVYSDGQTVTAVQSNALLSSIPSQPSLRRE